MRVWEDLANGISGYEGQVMALALELDLQRPRPRPTFHSARRHPIHKVAWHPSRCMDHLGPLEASASPRACQRGWRGGGDWGERAWITLSGYVFLTAGKLGTEESRASEGREKGRRQSG